MRGVIEWVLEHLYIVVFILVFLGQIVRGFFNTRKGRPPPQPLPDEMDEQRRVREIQEQIRRRIAERRGEEVRNDPPVLAREEAPPPRAEEPVPRRIETTQLPDPFEGPFRRVLQELEKKMQPPPAPPAPVSAAAAERVHGEMERQERLAEQMRLLEEQRVLVQRRAAHLAEAKQVEAQSEGALRSAARGSLLHELRDPESLRRAFVLREVLGTPVGLR